MSIRNRITENEMKMEFISKSNNEAFARISVAAFAAQLDPTIEELADIKTAVSEAVTNAIIHGYEKKVEKIRIHCHLKEQVIYIEVQDYGKGIENVKQAMEPMYTSKPELERSGMGFSFMEAFMDEISVESEPGKGTLVKMQRKIGKGRELWTTQSL